MPIKQENMTSATFHGLRIKVRSVDCWVTIGVIGVNHGVWKGMSTGEDTTEEKKFVEEAGSEEQDAILEAESWSESRGIETKDESANKAVK
jgi:hypothetical protein